MGSGGNDAQREAEAAERARQAQIAQSVGAIDSVFKSPAREAQYKDFIEAARSLYRDRLFREQKDNSLQMKFALGRSGNTGGSLARDQGVRLGEAFARGGIEAERLAQSDEAGLRQSDQESRLRLISMAQGGLDATTGISNAQSALRSNLQAGAGTRNMQSLSDLFSGFGDIFRKTQEGKANRQGQKWGYQGLYGASPFFGGSR
jgi:hypothetical protein